jgi:hypothetical protein
MKIRILNRGSRNQLIAERKGGGVEIADLGPKLPFHDIAHFVVERQLKLRNGFYGNIYDGFSVQQLSDKEIIRTLPLQSAVAEIVTRALQSLSVGACTMEQFMQLIGEEFGLYGIGYPLDLDHRAIHEMLSAYQGIVSQWDELKEGEGLELQLELD